MGEAKMSYRTLLVHVDMDGEIGGRVRLAAGLADHFHSHLIGAASWMARPPFIVEGVAVDPEPTKEDYDEMREVLGRRGREFRAFVGADRSKVEWRSSLDFPTEFVAREARAADLVIIGRDKKSHDPYRSTDPGALVLRTGRPVLVVPPGIQSLAAKRIVIAWKDTREARRAVQDALPFLKGANEVIVMEVTETGTEQDSMHRLKDVANYLSRHGVKAVAERVRPVEGTASSALLRLVEEQSADLIVSGAYGHTRLGEWMFGGMTQDMLTQSPICCLLSH
jgi:nucleotide-binding universal stress UspA family protein